ncbi:putative quinol monooxygenase [Pararobbsia silviterrae]|nr:antibiotic biosynthesis monooxygenase [Pararobbsia silviterrae]
MKIVSSSVLALAACIAMLGVNASAQADVDHAGIYQVTLINVLPDAVRHGNGVDTLFKDVKATLEKEPGIVDVQVNQQVGAPYNFTLIEHWKDQASLDASNGSAQAHALDDRLKPLLSGPVYRRVFKAFE